MDQFVEVGAGAKIVRCLSPSTALMHTSHLWKSVPVS